MLTQLECASCIVDDLRGALQILSLGEEIKVKILREAFGFLAHEFSRDKTPSYFITGVHRILKRISGIDTPFKERREKCNEIGLKIAEKVRKRVEPLKNLDRVSFLVKWAIAANELDFRTVGTGYGFDVEKIENVLFEHFEEDLAVDQIGEILRIAKNSRRILYIHDNVGEIALDKLLIGEFKRYADTVISALRGGPITSDATLEDGKKVGLQEVASQILLAGPDTLGISLEEMSDELRENLQTADIVIAKGQANYYALSEYRPKAGGKIACLFRTKCDYVSNIFGKNGKVNLAVIL